MKSLLSSLKRTIFISFILLTVFAGKESGCGCGDDSKSSSSYSSQGSSGENQSSNGGNNSGDKGTLQGQSSTPTSSFPVAPVNLTTKKMREQSSASGSHFSQGNSGKNQSFNGGNNSKNTNSPHRKFGSSRSARGDFSE